MNIVMLTSVYPHGEHPAFLRKAQARRIQKGLMRSGMPGDTGKDPEADCGKGYATACEFTDSNVAAWYLRDVREDGYETD